MSCASLIFRRPIPDDWERVTAVMPAHLVRFQLFLGPEAGA